MVLHNGAFLTVNVFCVSSWLHHLMLYLATSSVQVGIFWYHNPVSLLIESNLLDVTFIVKSNVVIVLMSVLIFACNEKIRKEQYVINSTNSQTKKQMTNAFNTSSSAKLIITKDGQIQMCNEEFEKVLSDAFELRQVPYNLFKFI